MIKQLSLLTQKRFAPYFWAQLLGALNDNVYKNALIIAITFTSIQSLPLAPEVLVNICAGVFILPFMLFSTVAGQLADKLEKSMLIRRLKFTEFLIALCVGLAFLSQNYTILIFVLFLLGTQAAFFGPVKYSILPQHLAEAELVTANGLVEMGTFLAILAGSILGTLLIALPQGPLWVTITVISLAALGWLASIKIPYTPACAPDLQLDYRPIKPIISIFKQLRRQDDILHSLFGISWFWFYGMIFLSQMPNYCSQVLGANHQSFTLVLIIFCIGISIGSLLCARLSGERIEIGLVPFGSIGLSLFALDLAFCSPAQHTFEVLKTPLECLQTPALWHPLIDFLMIGIFGGFYIVPLYSLILQRTKATRRSRVIGANNILNSIFMVCSSLFSILFLEVGLSIPQIFLVTALMNAAISLYIFRLVPEFLFRFLTWLLVSFFYRLQEKGTDRFPETGGAIIACNHVSFLDPLIIMATCKRPVRFVMDYGYYSLPLVHTIFKYAKCIPIASSRDNPEVFSKAMDIVAKALEDGELIGIFPEGEVTRTGKLNTFKAGIERIVQRTPVPVLPIALQGLWGSFFSRKHGKAMFHIPHSLPWSSIGINVGTLIPPEKLDRHALQEEVATLRGEWL